MRRQASELAELRKLKKKLLSKKYKSEIVSKALEESFSGPQVKMIMKKTKRVKKWSEEDIVNGLVLRSFSRRSYKFLRDKKLIPLPALSTLRHWVKGFRCQPGVITEVKQILKAHFNSEQTPLSKFAILSFDEMEISKCYEYDQESDQALGPHKKVQLAMVRGLFKKWKQPIFYQFDSPMKKELLFHIIVSTEETGVEIWGICCDLGNYFLLTSLGITPENPFFVHPVDKSRVIYVFPDAPHMLKLCRNHLLDDGIKIDDQAFISKSDMESILQKDCGEFKICPKLKLDSHIECHGNARQKVRPAAELLSHSSATALRCLFSGKEKQAEFIQTINDWFDVVNSRLQFDKNKLSCAYGVHYEEQRLALEKMYQQTERMRVGKHKNTIQFQKGILIGIKSLIMMFEQLREKYNIKYIRTICLNQDIGENTFSRLRALGATHNHPGICKIIFYTCH